MVKIGKIFQLIKINYSESELNSETLLFVLIKKSNLCNGLSSDGFYLEYPRYQKAVIIWAQHPKVRYNVRPITQLSPIHIPRDSIT